MLDFEPGSLGSNSEKIIILKNFLLILMKKVLKIKVHGHFNFKTWSSIKDW